MPAETPRDLLTPAPTNVIESTTYNDYDDLSLDDDLAMEIKSNSQFANQYSTGILPDPRLIDHPAASDTAHLGTSSFDDDQQTNNENWLLTSTAGRNRLAEYIFFEFYLKNLSHFLDPSATHNSLLANPAILPAAEDGPTSTAAYTVNSTLQQQLEGHGPILAVSTNLTGSNPTRPYYGDVFYSFQTVYWPIHCIICLVICTLGIFANVTNIIVLTRPNMITAVNTILSAMAFSDLIVNISNIPYLMHELSDSSNVTSFFSLQWAVYILFHAHTTVTAHTISIWLTCVLATWRYFVVCRSQSSNQRNWSVGLAKRTIVGVFLFVPVFCIPNYLSFAIIKEVTESNGTIYKVGFSNLADESQFIKTFHFWIFSCLTKLVPCVLLTFFTTVLIRKLLDARERRLRMAMCGNAQGEPHISMTERHNGNSKDKSSSCETQEVMLNSVIHDNLRAKEISHSNIRMNGIGLTQNELAREDLNKLNYGTMAADDRSSKDLTVSQVGLTEQNQEDDMYIATDCQDLGSSEFVACNNNEQPTIGGYFSSNRPKIMSQLIVESKSDNTATVSTTTTSAKMLAACEVVESARLLPHLDNSPRSASTCGAIQHYKDNSEDRLKEADKDQSMNASGKDLSTQYKRLANNGRDMLMMDGTKSAINMPNPRDANLKATPKRASETNLNKRNQSAGSTTLAPIQLVKLQAAQRQLSHNETTTRLLIAVMIVFLICEFPAGILAALCAILGQDFFENVYQPTGILTDLLALINSSVNFILYCFMSTQFRSTFYRTVLHCPAPQNVGQNGQALHMTRASQGNADILKLKKSNTTMPDSE